MKKPLKYRTVVLPFLIGKSFSAMSIYPFIFLKNKKIEGDQNLIRHELIHFRQQRELLWVFFFIWYFLEFVIKWMAYGERLKAYRNISFEREAYRYENDDDYPLNRKPFAFLQYLRI